MMIVYKVVKRLAYTEEEEYYFSSNVAYDFALSYKLNAPTVAKGDSLLFCFTNLSYASEHRNASSSFKLLECETEHEPLPIRTILPAWFDGCTKESIESFWNSKSYNDNPSDKDEYCYPPVDSYGVPSLTPLRVLP